MLDDKRPGEPEEELFYDTGRAQKLLGGMFDYTEFEGLISHYKTAEVAIALNYLEDDINLSSGDPDRESAARESWLESIAKFSLLTHEDRAELSMFQSHTPVQPEDGVQTIEDPSDLKSKQQSRGESPGPESNV